HAQTAHRHIARHLLFAAFALMTLFVIWNNERFLLNAAAPEWVRYNGSPTLLSAPSYGGSQSAWHDGCDVAHAENEGV
ncbi:MAG: hypothetical protein ABIS29_15285, partial [Vicinamibacterales bacterium]